MQSEETVAIRQHLQATDSDNFDIHVEEYIIQEHNDDQINSDGTVVWERDIRHSPRYTGVCFSPSQPSTLHKLHLVSWSAAAKNDAGIASRAHMHTPTSSSINSRFT